jgi:4-hydroxy-L-threonine phosphate dehydrogenase PdxA
VSARVRLAVSMGDPAGIGPEVALRAITARAVRAEVEPILVGDPGVWRDTAGRLGVPAAFSDLGKTAPPGHVAVRVTSELPARARVPGRPRSPSSAAACGAAAYAAIVESVRLVQAGLAAGVVTPSCSRSCAAACRSA